MNRIFNSMKKINYRLLLALLLIGLIPTVYTTVRIFLIGQLPGDWGFNIASQLSSVNLLYEILQEALILPLFYFIGMAIKNRLEFENKFRTGIIFTGAIYSILSIVNGNFSLLILFPVNVLKRAS